jgi:tRNA nucleotidyltransferase (CCA-adding enzyme)
MYPNSVSALSTENLPLCWELLPQPAYLVGGAVRDALLGRQSEYLDLDFVLPNNAVKTARAIARHYKAGFVLLDAQRQIARVVFKQATVDFALAVGSTLESDLRRRDYTINAIAYNPSTKELIDPLQGYTDLQQSLLRMVSPTNLQDDPLRLLRAYRQAAQLNFVIEPDTQSVIRQLAPLLGQVAAERVRVEIGYLLSSARGSQWLQTAWEDGLLATWFKNTTRSHLVLLATIDSTAIQLGQTYPQLSVELYQAVRDTIKTTWLAIAKLTCLVASDPETAEIELINLTYSRAEIKGVTTALKLLPQLKEVPPAQMSLAQQFFFFRTAGVVFPVVVVLAVAEGVSVEAIAPLIDRYLNPNDPVAHPTPLISGKDLMQALQLPSSPLVGELLLKIQLAQIEGKISTSKEAIEFASQLLDIR